MHACPPNLPRRESTAERRVAIGLAARALIIEKGVEGLRTRDIAERVGINIATLHYHVPTKEALIALVAETIRHDFRAQAMRRPRDGKTGLEVLRLEFEEFREIVTETPELIIILTELVERGRRDPVIGEIMLPLYDFWRNQFVDIFRLGIRDGSFRPDVDPHAAALIVTGTLSDFWRAWTDFSASIDAVFTQLEHAFTPPIALQG
ncbi:MAG: TetR/AcrR family transcriptional regulator [Devosia sp.]|nr:TetR/AcrR family transcriptional regulator [Devosia sp.]